MFYYIIVYLFTIMENINFCIMVATWVLSCVFIIGVGGYIIAKSEEMRTGYDYDCGESWTPLRELWEKVMKRSLIVLVPIILLNIAIPSEKEDLATIAVVGYSLNLGSDAIDKLDDFGDSQVGKDLKDIVALQLRGYKNRLENFGTSTPTPEVKEDDVKEVPVEDEDAQVEEAIKDVVDDELIDLIAKKVANSAKEKLKE